MLEARKVKGGKLQVLCCSCDPCARLIHLQRHSQPLRICTVAGQVHQLGRTLQATVVLLHGREDMQRPPRNWGP